MAAGTLGLVMSVPGQTMGVSVFTDYLLEALGLTRNQLSIAYMIGTLASAALLVQAGKLYDRFGSRITAAIASLSLAVVLLVLTISDALSRWIADISGIGATTTAFVVILLAFFGLRFWGQGVLTLASSNMIAKWFDRRRGFASGISGIFVSLGFSISPLIFNILIGRFGWRGAWGVIALLVGGVFFWIVLIVFRDNPEDCGLNPDGRRSEPHAASQKITTAEPSFTLPQARRCLTFWLFSLTLALSALYMTGMTFHIVSVFETSGMTRTQAVAIFLPGSIIAVTTHLLAGWLSDYFPLKRFLTVMLAAMSMSMIGLAILKPGYPVLMIIAGNGIAGGLYGLLVAVTWAKYFGRQYLGAVSGMNLSVMVLHSALGPYIFSQSLSWGGSYQPAAFFCLAMAAVLMVGSFRADPPTLKDQPKISPQPKPLPTPLSADAAE